MAAYEVSIQSALPTDAQRLTAVAHAAKRHWGYSDELIALWQADLTVTPEYIASHPVFCAMLDGEIVGFYALLHQGNSFELDHMWVTPQHIGTGVGKLLFDHAVHTARLLGGSVLIVVSDPHAEGFYLRMGARRVGEAPSKPEGRTLPLLAVEIEPRVSPSI
jgi:GNAT superfamily N-acetyltransferase